VLLFSVGVVADEGEHIGGEFDFQAFGFDSSSDEFEGCGDGGGFRAADAVDAGDVVRGEEHALFVDDLDDLLRQRQHVVFLRTSAQNDGEQLLIGEERRSLFEELFSGAFGLGYVLYFFHGSLACFSSGRARCVFAPFFRVSRALREAVFSSASIFAFSSCMRWSSFSAGSSSGFCGTSSPRKALARTD